MSPHEQPRGRVMTPLISQYLPWFRANMIIVQKLQKCGHLYRRFSAYIWRSNQTTCYVSLLENRIWTKTCNRFVNWQLIIGSFFHINFITFWKKELLPLKVIFVQIVLVVLHNKINFKIHQIEFTRSFAIIEIIGQCSTKMRSKWRLKSIYFTDFTFKCPSR